MTNQIVSVLYETERWVPGYTNRQEGCVDTLVLTVKKDKAFTQAFLFYHVGGWLLWVYSRATLEYGPYEFCTDFVDIERALINWIADPY